MDTEENINTPKKNISEEAVSEKVETNLPRKRKLPNFIPKNRVVRVILTLLIVVCLVYGIAKLPELINNFRLDNARNDVYKSATKAEYASVKDAAKKGLAVKKDDPYLLKGYIDASSSEGNLTGKEVTNFKDAKPYIDEAAKEYPNDFRMLLSIGYAYETAGKYSEAWNYYNRAVSVDPTSAEGYFHRGHVLQFLDRTQESDADYDKSYTIDKNYAPVLMVMGSRYFSENNLPASFEAFKKASEVPNITGATRSEALAAASKVRAFQMLYLPEAIAMAKKAVDINPDFSPALAQYASVSFINGDAKTASTYINKAIEANPRISRNYFLLAEMQRYNKAYKEALESQQEAISRVDNDNTLVGISQKNGATALYYYDLAKTYDMGKISVNIVPYLEYALFKNPNLKSMLKNDYLKFDFFKSLSKDPKFLKLIN